MNASWVIFIDKKKKKVLLLKRSDQVKNSGQWCFPGGSSKKTKPKKLAKKEALEEVGLKLKDIDLLLEVPTTDKNYYFYVYYLKIKSTYISLDLESSKYKWQYISKIRKQKNLHKSVKLFLDNFTQTILIK